MMDPAEQARRFYAYVWPLRAHVLRTARFLTRDTSEADDLAQETLMRAFRKIEQLDLAGNPKGWLSSILRNVRIDQQRLRASTILTGVEELENSAIAPTGEPPANPRDVPALLEALSDQALIDALHELPEEIRWSLLLVDVEQFTYAAAAEIMDVPEGTAKSRVHRGHGMLRSHLFTQRRPESPVPSKGSRGGS